MAFFEGLGEKITKGSQDAVQKTKDMAAVMNLNSENSSLDKANESTKNQIGNAIFDGIFKELDAEEIQENGEPIAIPADLWRDICQKAKIIKQNELIKKANEEKIRSLKGETPCPKCGKILPKDAAFCTSCGEKIVKEESIKMGQQSDSIVCPNCGKKLSADARFCTGCGTAVAEISNID